MYSIVRLYIVRVRKGATMEEELQDLNDIQPGDKVRIRSGLHTGARGVICTKVDELLEIDIGINDTVRVTLEEITDYSRAARRAWKAMPKRAGRPKGQKPVKRMVSMRLDADLWDMLQEATERGLIPSRERAVNDWVREQVVLLLSKDE